MVSRTFRVVDDGIVLIASARALGEYEFGLRSRNDLLDAMRARELVCVATGRRGETVLVVDDDPNLDFGDELEQLGTYRLKVRPGDALVALPSTKVDAPVGGMPWAPGIYDVTVAREAGNRRVVFGIQPANDEAANELDVIPGSRPPVRTRR